MPENTAFAPKYAVWTCGLAVCACTAGIVVAAQLPGPSPDLPTADPMLVWAIRAPRLLALPVAIYTSVRIAGDLFAGRRRPRLDCRLDSLATVHLALGAVMLVSLFVELATIGAQPAIVAFLCVPVVWLGIGVGVVILGTSGCTTAETKPKFPCPVTLEYRDSGATYDGKNYSDFSFAPGPGGQQILFAPFMRTPSPPGQLGYVSGTYPNTNPLVSGFFKKTEVRVTCPAPCEIVKVERTRKTLPGYAVANTRPKPDGPDGPDAQSIHKVDPLHYWVITDAPGFTDPSPNNRYAKEFVVTGTFKDVAGKEFTDSVTYSVIVALDGAGDIDPNPR